MLSFLAAPHCQLGSIGQALGPHEQAHCWKEAGRTSAAAGWAPLGSGSPGAAAAAGHLCSGQLAGAAGALPASGGISVANCPSRSPLSGSLALGGWLL